MPNKDGTGPDGKGPKTGRGMGNCEGAEKQSAPRSARARMGAGRGRGPGRCFNKLDQ